MSKPVIIMAALAVMERDLVRELTQAGLATARARGRKGGRPRTLAARQLELAQSLLQDPSVSVSEVARTMGSIAPRSIGRSGGRGDREATGLCT